MPRISKATEYNWKKLNSDKGEKLTKRANKTLSRRRVIATGYLDFAPANMLLSIVSDMDASVGDIMYSLCVSLLRFRNLYSRNNVYAFISQFGDCEFVDIDVPEGVWNENCDVLGFIYQSLVSEGDRNVTGQYYTKKDVVECVVSRKTLSDGETFLDPCCGSGAFLLSVDTDTPECLFGFDVNPVAVMIAGVNLLVKYSDHDFVPQVYCLDFLKRASADYNGYGIPSTFDNIYTNPPWGADKDGMYRENYPEIKSKERSSMVIVESLRRLSRGGSSCFVLPTSLLKIKSHNDVRKYILANSTILRIDLYSERFDGVFTDYFSIKLSANQTDSQRYVVSAGGETRNVELSRADKASGMIRLEQLTNIDDSIIGKLEARRHDDLKHSQWALGIVTGDNRNKVKREMSVGLEPVYAGKQVMPFNLQDESSYVLFDPKSFQQCAKEEYFRASEKLIYRFIAKYPIVAYDDKQCLCLNSANILIPKLDGISVKSAAALLNSSLYHYYYSLRFSDIKVLKGNLQELPFPKLTKCQDEALSDIVTSIKVYGFTDELRHELDDTVYAIFDISSVERQQVESRIM